MRSIKMPAVRGCQEETGRACRGRGTGGRGRAAEGASCQEVLPLLFPVLTYSPLLGFAKELG